MNHPTPAGGYSSWVWQASMTAGSVSEDVAFDATEMEGVLGSSDYRADHWNGDDDGGGDGLFATRDQPCRTAPAVAERSAGVELPSAGADLVQAVLLARCEPTASTSSSAGCSGSGTSPLPPRLEYLDLPAPNRPGPSPHQSPTSIAAGHASSSSSSSSSSLWTSTTASQMMSSSTSSPQSSPWYSAAMTTDASDQAWALAHSFSSASCASTLSGPAGRTARQGRDVGHLRQNNPFSAGLFFSASPTGSSSSSSSFSASSSSSTAAQSLSRSPIAGGPSSPISVPGARSSAQSSSGSMASSPSSSGGCPMAPPPSPSPYHFSYASAANQVGVGAAHSTVLPGYLLALLERRRINEEGEPTSSEGREATYMQFINGGDKPQRSKRKRRQQHRRRLTTSSVEGHDDGPVLVSYSSKGIDEPSEGEEEEAEEEEDAMEEEEVTRCTIPKTDGEGEAEDEYFDSPYDDNASDDDYEEEDESSSDRDAEGRIKRLERAEVRAMAKRMRLMHPFSDGDSECADSLERSSFQGPLQQQQKRSSGVTARIRRMVIQGGQEEMTADSNNNNHPSTTTSRTAKSSGIRLKETRPFISQHAADDLEEDNTYRSSEADLVDLLDEDHAEPDREASYGYSHLSIRVKTLSGKFVTLGGLSPWSTVEEVKEKLEEKCAVPRYQQRLIFQGRQMADTRTLEHYCVRSNSILYMVLALRGGRHPAAAPVQEG